MKNKIMKLLLLSLSILILASCGGKDGGGGSSPSSTIQEQVAEGSYRAVVRPLNNSLSGFIPSGFAEIKITGNDVSVKTLLDDDARVAHMQSIHVGTQCPTMAHDANKDGLIDAVEMKAVTGEVLIPLDSDINSDELGAGVYPVGRNFTYLENAELGQLEADVRARTGQNLNLGGRVVIMHGVDAKTNMPATVATVNGMTPQASVPIACGIIQRVEAR